MKKLHSLAVAGILGVGTTVALSLGAVSTAQAGSTCQINKGNPGQYYKSCGITGSVSGARLNGVSTWFYDAVNNQGHSVDGTGRFGTIAGTLFDTEPDSVCAFVELQVWQNGANISGNAGNIYTCGNGKTLNYEYDLNKEDGFDIDEPDPGDWNPSTITNPMTMHPDSMRSGTFKLFVCSPKTYCSQVWSQSITELGPNESP